MFHAIKTKNISITIIFSFILTLKDTIIWIKKNTKRKVDKLLKKYRFNEFAAFNQKRKNNMNQFTKKKRFDKFLKNEIIVKNQKNLYIFISTPSKEYNLKIILFVHRKMIYDRNISKTVNIAVQRS